MQKALYLVELPGVGKGPVDGVGRANACICKIAPQAHKSEVWPGYGGCQLLASTHSGRSAVGPLFSLRDMRS